MPSVTAKQNESSENIIRRFKRACEKAGIINEAKKRLTHIKRTKQKAAQKAASIKRSFKRKLKEAPIPSRGIRGRKKDKKRR